MTEKVNDLMEKISKLEIEAKFEKWDEFPPEIKLECIKKMDFKMRFGLRSTSHTERALVDSLRYKFDRIYLAFDSLRLKNGNKYENFEEYHLKLFDRDNQDLSMKKAILLLTYILNQCDIGRLNINFLSLCVCDWSGFDNCIQSLPDPIRVKNLYLHGLGYEHPMLVLKKCWTSIEFVEMSVSDEDIPLDKFFTLPSIINAKEFVIPFIFKYQIVPLIKEWLKLDMKIGTQFGIESQNAYSLIAPELKHRIVSHDNSLFRISTDNPEKHILMFETEPGGLGGLRCVVIPSNLGKSKYDELIRNF